MYSLCAATSQFLPPLGICLLFNRAKHLTVACGGRAEGGGTTTDLELSFHFAIVQCKCWIPNERKASSDLRVHTGWLEKDENISYLFRALNIRHIKMTNIK